MSKVRYTLLIASLALGTSLLSAPAYADEATAKRHFQQGMAHFKQGEQAQAIKAFEAARRAGLDHPALYYNLGVAYYRSGDYARAYQTFLKAANDAKFAQLIHYNLGLCAQKQGQNTLAKSWFEKAARGGKQNLRELALYQLDQLSQGAAEQFMVLSLGLGNDDNVLDPSTLTAQSESDQFLELYLSGRTALDAHWQLQGAFYYQDYMSIDAYDLNTLKLGVDHVAQAGGWKTSWGGEFEHSTLDGTPYLNTLTLGLKHQQTATAQARWRYRLRASQISAQESVYDPQQGMQVRADVRWQSANRDWSAGYGLEWNDRDDLTEATTFTSYSPLSHQLNIDLNKDLAKDWQARAGVSLKSSSYADANRLDDGSLVEREDNLIEWELGLEHNLEPNMVLSLSVTTTDNDSNIDDNDYDRTQWLLGLHYLWD